MLWAIAFATPFFLFWGWLSDKIGRKWIMMAGMLLAILTYRPIFSTFLNDTEIKESDYPFGSGTPQKTITKITETKDTIFTLLVTKMSNETGSITFDIVGKDTVFAKNDISASKQGNLSIEFKNKKLSPFLYWKFIGLVFILILYVTMVYGPIAAFLVEMFPTKIRYTSMSLPYHIGNGVFGGLVPFIGLLLTTTYPADPLVGLWYPIGVAILCFIIGTLYLENKIDKNVMD